MTFVFPNVALPPGGISEGFAPCQNMHTHSPLGVSSTILEKNGHICCNKVEHHSFSFKNSQIYLVPVHDHTNVPLKNAVHHFSERECSPLAAAAAAAASFAGKKNKGTHRVDSLRGRVLYSGSMETVIAV